MKIYTRDDNIRADVIRKNYPFHFKGGEGRERWHVEDIYKKCGGFTCRLCGWIMVPYGECDGQGIWNCTNPTCFNNLDEKVTTDLHDVNVNIVGNTDRKWANWMPKRLI